MLLKSFFYFVLSLLVIGFSPLFHRLIVYLDIFYVWLNLQISPIFSQSPLALMLQKSLVLVSLPLLFAYVPALLYKQVKGREFPYLTEFIWSFWLILVLSNLLIH